MLNRMLFAKKKSMSGLDALKELFDVKKKLKQTFIIS